MTMKTAVPALAWLLLIVGAVLSSRVQAQDSSATPEEVIEQILELHRQIEALMATLPPEVRDPLRRRLKESSAAEITEAPPQTPPTAPASVTPSPPSSATESVEATSTPEASEPVPKPDLLPTSTPEPTPAPSPAPTETQIATATPAVEAPPPPSDIPKLIRRRSRRAPCNTLQPLDENGDGKISSADRYWRYFYVWADKNGDGQLQEREVESAYDRRVREISVSLETFIRAKGGLGEIRVQDRIFLDLSGDGFSERARRDDGILTVDADALSRGDGPRLLGSGGEPLSGFVAFRSGLRLEQSGQVTELNCP